MDAIELPELIKGERVTLKKHKMDYAQPLFKIIDNNRGHLGRFFIWVDNTNTVADTKEFIKLCLEWWDNKEKFNFAVFYKDTDELIGTIGLFNIKWNHDSAELGYWISSAYQGRGLMAESVKALEKECFSLNFHRLEIRTQSENKRSSAVARRCGFHQDGILRDTRKTREGYDSEVVFSRLSTDD